jgi:hypothetical protein
MDKQTILQLALVFHLVALGMAMGITLANAVANNQFWKLYDKSKEQGLAAFRATMKFRVFGMIGLALLILTGVVMLWAVHWTLVELLWFKIKLFLVFLLFVNGFTLGRTTSEKLEKVLKAENNSGGVHLETIRLRRNIQIFQLTQLGLFISIIILAVFRFT